MGRSLGIGLGSNCRAKEAVLARELTDHQSRPIQTALDPTRPRPPPFLEVNRSRGGPAGATRIDAACRR